MISLSHGQIIESLRAMMGSIVEGTKVTVHIDDEQNFVKMGEISRNTIYIAVHFNEATVNFATSVCPITLTALGTENCMRPTQEILFKFANTYNNTAMEGLEGNTVRQLWRSPVVISNFVETGADFRSLYSMSGTLLIGSNIVDVQKIEYHKVNGTWEQVDFLSFSDSLNNQLEPQAFLDSNGFTESESKFCTYTFSFNTYLLNTELITRIMMLKGFSASGTGTVLGNNTDFEFRITWGNGLINNNRKFKLASCQNDKRIGDIPTITVTFTH